MEKLYLLITEKSLSWTFWRWEIRSFLSQKVDGKTIFTWYFLAFSDIPRLRKYGFLCSGYIDLNVRKNDEDPKFEVGDHVRILKYKRILYKRLHSKLVWSSFYDKKDKNTVPWTYVISDLNGEEIVGTFYEKELQKTNQTEIRAEKVLKREEAKLYVKCKGYDNSFNSLLNKKVLLYKKGNFPEPYTLNKSKIKAEFEFSDYTTKSDLKTQQVHQVLLKGLI